MSHPFCVRVQLTLKGKQIKILKAYITVVQPMFLLGVGIQPAHTGQLCITLGAHVALNIMIGFHQSIILEVHSTMIVTLHIRQLVILEGSYCDHKHHLIKSGNSI